MTRHRFGVRQVDREEIVDKTIITNFAIFGLAKQNRSVFFDETDRDAAKFKSTDNDIGGGDFEYWPASGSIHNRPAVADLVSAA